MRLVEHLNKMELIISILRDVSEYEQDHHMGRPFMTAYQIAIRFAERNPDHEWVMQYNIGGSGTGEYNSLAQQVARYLSQQFASDSPPVNLEGGFISHDNIKELSFKGPGETIHSSTLGSENGQSIFRYVGEE